MNTTTITTTRKLTTMSIGDGKALNLPARVPGVTISTEKALRNALKYTTANDLHAYLVECWGEAERLGWVTDAQVLHHFVTWCASAGDWAE